MSKRELWSEVFCEVITMTEAELLATLSELGATSPEAAYRAYQAETGPSRRNEHRLGPHSHPQETNDNGTGNTE